MVVAVRASGNFTADARWEPAVWEPPRHVAGRHNPGNDVRRTADCLFESAQERSDLILGDAELQSAGLLRIRQRVERRRSASRRRLAGASVLSMPGAFSRAGGR